MDDILGKIAALCYIAPSAKLSARDKTMAGSVLYDDDILLWSEEQADLIRKLDRTRRYLPNALDIENVAEEIESVGRSELASVKSFIRLVLIHLIKLVDEPQAEVAAHWRSEIGGFVNELRDRYAPSMRHRIDLDDLWRSVREQLMLRYLDAATPPGIAALPVTCPVVLDDLLGERIDVRGMVERVRQSAAASASG